MREVVIVGAKRTPIGSFMGALSSVPSPTLGAAAMASALKDCDVDPKDVGMVYMGCVLPAGVGQAPARQASIAAGIPNSTPCTTVNKVCGSGLKTVLLAAQAIAIGDCDVAVAGGMENMSLSPHLMMGLRGGVKMGALKNVDSMVHDGLWDPYNNQHMGNCAELCAKEKGFSREDQDAFAAESYRRAQKAVANGLFDKEIVPVTVKHRKGDIVVDKDEEPGRGVIEKLPKLRTAFDKQGTVTAGNASSINDGAAALVLMSKEEAVKRKCTILATVVSSSEHAQEPKWFTTAPAASIEKACKKAEWKPADVDLWEINEAFAVVSLANNKMLGLDSSKVNIDGGAVSLGHPIGASGARILVTLLHAMERKNAKTGGASLCIGGGEGICLLVKRD